MMISTNVASHRRTTATSSIQTNEEQPVKIFDTTAPAAPLSLLSFDHSHKNPQEDSNHSHDIISEAGDNDDGVVEGEQDSSASQNNYKSPSRKPVKFLQNLSDHDRYTLGLMSPACSPRRCTTGSSGTFYSSPSSSGGGRLAIYVSPQSRRHHSCTTATSRTAFLEKALLTASPPSSNYSIPEDNLKLKSEVFQTLSRKEPSSSSSHLSFSSPSKKASSSCSPRRRHTVAVPAVIAGAAAAADRIEPPPTTESSSSSSSVVVGRRRLLRKCRAAGSIQAVFRGYLLRRRLRTDHPALDLPSGLRGRIRRLAAVRIQSAMRGCICRLRCTVLRYERRLADVALQKQRDLRRVEREKERNMKLLEQKATDNRCLELRLKGQKVFIEKAERTIHHLQYEREQLLQANDELHEACGNLKRYNRKFTSLRQRVSDLEEANPTWEQVASQLRQSVELYREMVEERTLYGEGENLIRQTYQDTLEEIILNVENRAADDALAWEVAALAKLLTNNVPGGNSKSTTIL